MVDFLLMFVCDIFIFRNQVGMFGLDEMGLVYLWTAFGTLL